MVATDHVAQGLLVLQPVFAKSLKLFKAEISDESSHLEELGVEIISMCAWPYAGSVVGGHAGLGASQRRVCRTASFDLHSGEWAVYFKL